jgi:hypothetical protein
VARTHPQTMRHAGIAAALLACAAAGALSSIALARSSGTAASAAYYYYCPGVAGANYGYCPPTTTTPTTTGPTIPTEGKVEICHRTSSAVRPYVRIEVSVNSLDAHQKHGDIIPAPATCPDQ